MNVKGLKVGDRVVVDSGGDQGVIVAVLPAANGGVWEYDVHSDRLDATVTVQPGQVRAVEAPYIIPQAADLITAVADLGGTVSYTEICDELKVKRLPADLTDVLRSLVNVGYLYEFQPAGRSSLASRMFHLSPAGAVFTRPAFVFDASAAREWLLADHDDPEGDASYAAQQGIDASWGSQASDAVTRDIACVLADLPTWALTTRIFAGGGDGYSLNVEPVAGGGCEPFLYRTVVETPRRGAVTGRGGPRKLTSLLNAGGAPVDVSQPNNAGVERLLLAIARVVTEANAAVRCSLSAY